MKRTPERTADDDAFVRQFAPALKRVYRGEKEVGMTDQEFAESIGVERPQLNRILDGESMPSVRTVAFAHQEYKIAIPYSRVSMRGALPTKRGKQKPAPTSQMVLPFTIQTGKGGAKVDLKLAPISARTFALRLIVDRAG